MFLVKKYVGGYFCEVNVRGYFVRGYLVKRLLRGEATLYGGYCVARLLCYRLLCEEATLLEANL